MTCPECDEGLVYGFFCCSVCPICEGTGILPSHFGYRPAIGQALKEERMRAGKTLRQYCKEKKMDAQLRSERERGYFRYEP
jgi:hypothetical protein